MNEEVQNLRLLIAKLEEDLKINKEVLRLKTNQCVISNIKNEFEKKVKEFEEILNQKEYNSYSGGEGSEGGGDSRKDEDENKEKKLGLLIPNTSELTLSFEEEKLIDDIIEVFKNDSRFKVLEGGITETWNVEVTFYDKEDKSDANDWEKELRETKCNNESIHNNFTFFIPKFNDNDNDILSGDCDYESYVGENLNEPSMIENEIRYNDWDDPAMFRTKVEHNPIVVILVK